MARRNSIDAEFFDLRSIAPQPWKNGAGWTREIASAPSATEPGGFDWRFSVAEVEREAPFSRFAGIDRCIVLLRGAGLWLHGDDGGIDHRLAQPFLPFHFRGEAALTGTPIAGPSSDFNAMTRRGVWRAELSLQRAAFAFDPGAVSLLLCCEGHCATGLSAAPRLQAQQGLLLRDAGVTVACTPSGGEAACLLLARLCHDRAP
jgi:uncharacterized protein